MNRFILEFGQFFWIWKALGIYFIMTGVMWMVMLLVIKSDDNKVVAVKVKENVEDED